MQVHVHSVCMRVEAGDQHRVSSLIVHLIFLTEGLTLSLEIINSTNLTRQGAPGKPLHCLMLLGQAL